MVCTSAGDAPNDRNHTVPKTMSFTIKKTHFSLTTKDLTHSASSGVEAPTFSEEPSRHLITGDIGTRFELSPSISDRLQSGQLDEHMNDSFLADGKSITENLDDTSLAGQLFGDPLTSGGVMGHFDLNAYSNHDQYLDPESYISSIDNERARDARGGASSSEGYWQAVKKGYDLAEKINDMKGMAENADTVVNGSKGDKICLALTTTTEVVGGVVGSAGGPVGAAAGAAAGGFVGDELCKVSKGQKTTTQGVWEWVKSLFTMPSPEDPSQDESEVSGRATSLISSYLEKYGNNYMDSLEQIDVDTDPHPDFHGDRGPYSGPSLGMIGGSNGGTSTGAWEVNGGDYVGPGSLGSLMNIDLTSTGNDWF